MADGGQSGLLPVAALFPAPHERERIDDLLTRALLAADRRVNDGAVTPTIDLAAFRRELAGFDFAESRPIEPLLAWAIDGIERGVVHVTHPRYFGLFNPAPSFPAQCADRIAAAFNPQLATATTSPAAVAIEAHAIHAVVRRVGLPADSTGHFTTGGSEANCTALICALTRAHAGFTTHGARAFPGAPVFYVSRESHRAWVKIAHQSGIGRDAMRLVGTDGAGRLDPEALARAIAADRAAGCVPVLVAATAGTTGAGMIDPLAACAGIARENGMWCHIDAAWGGALIASPRLRGALAGIEEAHSVTIDAHKWFATTMGCGMFLTRDPTSLSAAFQVFTGYMPSKTDGVDPYVTSLQWSRRFAGLRLFLSLAAAGWPGYARHVERAVELAAFLEAALGERGWQIVNRSPLAVVCADPPPGSAGVRTIAERVLASGLAWVSVAEFEGRPVLRACVTHGETTAADVTTLVAALERAAAQPA
ncbi:MAG TPA: pyridoxal-dependent decarboxylase [Stellaceae bacterium]|nr:pyridoxal-dependent decarboxylase [Stellaceae bacterium]